MIRKTAAVMMICLCAFSSVAQDKIIHMGKDTIRCAIREIGDTEIKYTKEGFKADLIFGIDKNQVSEIIFADGRNIKFKDSMHDPVFYVNQRKNAIKFGFLSPLFNATSFSYERSLGIAHSIEGTIGFIGLGYREYTDIDAKGVYLKIGYKLIKSPDFYLKGMHYAHILKGGYIKPEIDFSAYHYRSTNNITYHNTLCAFLLNFGKQWILEDSFLVDIYAGFGYGFGHNEGGDSMHYAFIGSEEGNPFAFAAGLKIGFLLK